MLIKRLLLSSYKRKLKKNWEREQVSDELKAEYTKNKSLIKEIYKKVTHWHGTGRYHYKVEGETKYDSSVNPNVLIDVLDKIIKSNGISPAYDPWVQGNGVYTDSISTTEWKQYARIYAELHCTPSTKPEIAYGDRYEAIKFFLYYTIANVPIIGLPKVYYAGAIDKRFNNKGPIWAATINNTLKSSGNSYKDLVQICGLEYSNIENNYGLLFGINANNLKPAYINPLIALFETRFIERITFNDITHVEVPNSKVEEVKKIFKKKNIVIPVLPLELCEMYCATLPDKELFSKSGYFPLVPLRSYIDHYLKR